jgi:hypothetical protein
MDGYITPPRKYAPPGAEARGKRRLWKAETAKRFAQMKEVFSSTEVRRAAKQLAKVGAPHAQAVAVLNHSFAGLATPIMKETGRRAALAWLAIDANAESPFRGVDRELSPDEQQPVASCFYIVTTTPQKGLVLRGLWSLTITDHALGRYFERNPSGDLDQAIIGGHSTLMKSPERCVERMIRVPELLISDGGDGAWMISGGYYKSQDDLNRKALVWRARSWV